MFSPGELVEGVYLDCSWSYISHKDYLKPNAYLQDAIEDLKSGNERRNLNNSIRNAKSALHMRVDILCASFAGENYFKKNLKNFPSKMDFLEKIGIVRPRIMDKINKNRNEIEHDYRDASLEESEDFIDIVLLFMEATKCFNSRFPCDGVFQGDNLSEEGYLRKVVCNWQTGELVFYFTYCGRYNLNNMNQHVLKVGDDKYPQWVKYIIDSLD